MAARRLSEPLGIADLQALLEIRDGILVWRPRNSANFRGAVYLLERWNARWAGQPALTARRADGYLVGNIYGRQYLAHRVIWAMAEGEWPLHIDHIDGDRGNNDLANLRNVSPGENGKNHGRYITNKAGVMGLKFSYGKWEASIKTGGKEIYLGRHRKKEDAIRARLAAEKKYGFHPNHGQRDSYRAAR